MSSIDQMLPPAIADLAARSCSRCSPLTIYRGIAEALSDPPRGEVTAGFVYDGARFLDKDSAEAQPLLEQFSDMCDAAGGAWPFGVCRVSVWAVGSGQAYVMDFWRSRACAHTNLVTMSPPHFRSVLDVATLSVA